MLIFMDIAPRYKYSCPEPEPGCLQQSRDFGQGYQPPAPAATARPAVVASSNRAAPASSVKYAKLEDESPWPASGSDRGGGGVPQDLAAREAAVAAREAALDQRERELLVRYP